MAIFSKRLLPAGAILVVLAASASGGRADPAAGPAAAPAVAIPAPETLLMLVRTTLVALNQANFTGNYTVLHGLGSPALQARHNPAGLSDAFAQLRARNVDLSPVLVLSPQLTEGPVITPEGVLAFSGFFPTEPLRVEFSFRFVPVEGRWRIEGLAVNAVPVSAGREPLPSARSTSP